MTNFAGRGYYRGNLEQMMADAINNFKRLSPEAQQRMLDEQRESWVRGEMAMRESASIAPQISEPPPDRGEIQQEVKPALAAAPDETFTQGERKQARGQAVSMGYTGDQCTNCNSMRMKVSGHCMVCEDCGTTTGCS
jgi:hypothetical protein